MKTTLFFLAIVFVLMADAFIDGRYFERHIFLNAIQDYAEVASHVSVKFGAMDPGEVRIPLTSDLDHP